jgi:hypothetical protein
MGQLKSSIKRQQQIATIAGYDSALSLAQQGFVDLMQQVEIIKAQHLADMDRRDKALEVDRITHSSELSNLQQQLDIALDPIAHRRNNILSLTQHYMAEFGQEPTQGYLAEQTGYSVQTIRGDLKALNGSAKNV